MPEYFSTRTGFKLLRKRVIPLGVYLLVEVQEGRNDPRERIIIKLISKVAGTLSSLMAYTHAAEELDTPISRVARKGYTVIDAKEVMTCRRFRMDDAPKLVNWLWFSDEFKHDVFGCTS